VSGYTAQLFSKSLAQKVVHDCPENQCIITEVSPLDYNITFSKDWYVSQVIPTDIKPRSNQEILVNFEKKTVLINAQLEELTETPKERIQRIREQSQYYANFNLGEGRSILFSQKDIQLSLAYRQDSEIYQISDFPLVSKDEISVDTISGSSDIYIALWDAHYIFHARDRSVTKLPYQFDIEYIKSWRQASEYLVVSDKGVFVYNTTTNTSQYEYQFSDFLYLESYLIGVIFEDEEQKKKNFNLEKPGNLIIRYSQKDKSRKIIYSTKENIKRLEWQWEKILITTNEWVYELQNY